MKKFIWDESQAQSLRQQMAENSLDEIALARLGTLSLKQIQELLECTGDLKQSSFYSPAIKAYAGTRLLDKLSPKCFSHVEYGGLASIERCPESLMKWSFSDRNNLFTPPFVPPILL